MRTAINQNAIISNIIRRSLDRVASNKQHFGARFPSYGDGDHTYHLTANKNWLSAFWAGLMWLRAFQTQRVEDVQAACDLTPTFEHRLDRRIHLNHDLGFLFLLSARPQWQHTGGEAARKLAVRGADYLAERFHPNGGYIQAWHDTTHPDERGRFIIDCMMNLPLLWWASRETGQARYADIARTHALTSAKYLIREDGGTYHTYFLDADTGQPVGPKTHQGFADDSLWARGQAWAIYGFAMAAEWTGEAAFREVAIAVATRYCQEAPPDAISPWDYALPDEATPYPDSSADAIAASGLLRLADLTNDESYRKIAVDRLDILIKHAFDERDEAQGLLLHGTQHAPHNYGVNTYTIFGDYFFLEALMKLQDTAPDFWGPDSK